MFELSKEEADALRSQFVTSNVARGDEAEPLTFQIGISKPTGLGGRRYLPFAFTEHGVAMLSSVLNSKRAVQMNILKIRAFVQIRELLATNRDLAVRVEKLEGTQTKHASIISLLAEEIDELKLLPEPPKRRIGYKPTSIDPHHSDLQTGAQSGESSGAFAAGNNGSAN